MCSRWRRLHFHSSAVFGTSCMIDERSRGRSHCWWTDTSMIPRHPIASATGWNCCSEFNQRCQNGCGRCQLAIATQSGGQRHVIFCVWKRLHGWRERGQCPCWWANIFMRHRHLTAIATGWNCCWLIRRCQNGRGSCQLSLATQTGGQIYRNS